MELAERFKQTDIGEIPDDWNLLPLPDVAWFQEGPGVRNYQFTRSGVKLFNGTNIQGGRIDLLTTNRFISQREAYGPYAHFLADSGDVVIACSGVSIDRFHEKVSVLSNEHLPLCMNTSTMRFKVASQRLNSAYFVHFLRSAFFKQQINGSATGSAQLNFGPAHVAKVLIPVPPTKREQEAIAEALTDADAYIELLEQLLTKKRDMMHGAMHELLTRERRLPGFPNNWQEVTLEDVGIWRGGMTPSMSNPRYWNNGTVPWVSSGDVKTSTLHDTSNHITPEAIKDNATTIVPLRSIVVVMRSGILRKYLPVSLTANVMAINQDIKALIPYASFDPHFLLFSLLRSGPAILQKCMKLGTTVESIEFRWLKKFPMLVPKIEEQRAIASFFSAMQAEINSLETNLVKVRNIKQGMMQQLLTGRVRLI